MAQDELDVKMKYFSPHRFIRTTAKDVSPEQIRVEIPYNIKKKLHFNFSVALGNLLLRF